MPDAHGKFKGISVPRLPWREKEQAEALTQLSAEKRRKANRDKPGPSA